MFNKSFRIGQLSWRSSGNPSADISGSDEPATPESRPDGNGRSADAEFQQLLERRIIFMNGSIDDDSAARIIAMLIYLEREDDSSPIQLHISSPGGSVAASLAIIDSIRYLRAPVHTFCLGNAQGMAAVILASGSRGHRRATPHARIALTPLPRASTEPLADPETYYKELLRIQKMVIDLVMEFTGQPEPEVHDALEVGRWFNASEAKEYGLIDEVAS